jgi:hypothetical protein
MNNRNDHFQCVEARRRLHVQEILFKFKIIAGNKKDSFRMTSSLLYNTTGQVTSKFYH